MSRDEFNPFASPEAVGGPVPAEAVSPTELPPYVSAKGRSLAAMACLGLNAIVAVVHGYLALHVNQLIDVAQTRGATPQLIREMEDAEGLSQVIALGGLVLLVATAVAFLMWKHRSHKNLKALGAVGMNHTPGWAVGGYFVPFLNLIRPCQVMIEIARGSDPHSIGVYLRDKRHVHSLPLVGFWWAAWLLHNILGNVVLRLRINLGDPPDITDVTRLNTLDAVDDAVTVIAAILAIFVVHAIQARQDARYERLYADQ